MRRIAAVVFVVMMALHGQAFAQGFQPVGADDGGCSGPALIRYPVQDSPKGTQWRSAAPRGVPAKGAEVAKVVAPRVSWFTRMVHLVTRWFR